MPGAVYGRAEQAAKTSGNAGRLLKLVKWVDLQLAKVVAQGSKTKWSSEARDGSKALAQQLVGAGRLLHNYCGRGFLLRWVTATSDCAAFKAVDTGIRDAMQVGQLAPAVLLYHHTRAPKGHAADADPIVFMEPVFTHD